MIVNRIPKFLPCARVLRISGKRSPPSLSVRKFLPAPAPGRPEAAARSPRPGWDAGMPVAGLTLFPVLVIVFICNKDGRRGPEPSGRPSNALESYVPARTRPAPGGGAARRRRGRQAAGRRLLRELSDQHRHGHYGD